MCFSSVAPTKRSRVRQLLAVRKLAASLVALHCAKLYNPRQTCDVFETQPMRFCQVFPICADATPPRLASRRPQGMLLAGSCACSRLGVLTFECIITLAPNFRQLHLQLHRRSLGLRLRHAKSGPGIGDPAIAGPVYRTLGSPSTPIL